MSQRPSTASQQIPILISLFLDEKSKALMRFLKRRIQSAGVFIYAFAGLVWPWICTLIVLLITFSPLFPLALLYAAWYWYDFKTPEQGARLRPAARDWFVYRLIADYFPIKIVKTADLPIEHNYIIGCHPHGIGCFGTYISLCTSATNFNHYFPGISSTAATLKGMFYFPIRREGLLLSGLIAVTNESLDYYLKNGEGKAVGIVVGGAEELLDAHPGKNDLTLSNRKGFVRVALRNGAHLVPMYCFGENDLYSQIPNERGTLIRDIQEFIKKYLRWSPTITYGKLSFGFLPKRKPIYCVFGRPIEVNKNLNPREEEVNEIHQKYCNELQNLFDKYKVQCGLDESAQLEFH